MKVNTTKLIILVLLIALSWANHMRRRRIKRLGLEKRKEDKWPKWFKELFEDAIKAMHLETGEKLGAGAFGKVFAIKGKNQVVKAVRYQGDEDFFYNEVNMTKKAKGLSFSVPLCDFDEFISSSKEKGLIMFFPRAKRDLSKAVEENKIEFKKKEKFGEMICNGLNKFGKCFTDLFEGNNTNDIYEKETESKLNYIFHLITQMAIGLKELHTKKNLVHGDIKAANYLMFEKPNPESKSQSNLNENIDKVLLADFGLAVENTEKQSGIVSGTPTNTPYFDYVKSDGKGGFKWKTNYTVSQKFDVYSLGITMLRVFNEDVFKETIQPIVKGLRSKDPSGLTFKNYEIFLTALQNNLKEQREEFEIPEKQIQLEDYLLEKVLVPEKDRDTSKQLAEFIRKMNQEQYDDIIANYQEPIQCDY